MDNILNLIDQIYKRKKQLTLNIGYDFDGVLHVDVGPEDSQGQRHPNNFTGPYTPFNEIINQIKEEYRKGYNVYIITARGEYSKHTIRKFLDDNQLNFIQDDHIFFTHNRNKKDILRKYNINIFYDDSCIRIKQLNDSKSKIPSLKKLYLVHPEKNSWTLITDERLHNFCIK